VTDLVREALRLGQFLPAQRWRYCFIGGLAVQHRGEPFFTPEIH
jgi:hypothetical protein